MSDQAYRWHKVAGSENEIRWSAAGIGVVELGERKICLAKWRGQWFGFADRCPHAGGALADGHIDAKGNLVCPVHQHRFSMQSGRDWDDEGYRLMRWPVEERPDGIYIRMEEAGFSNDPGKINFLPG